MLLIKITGLNSVLAIIIALLFHPDKSDARIAMPINKPKDAPIKIGLIILCSFSRLIRQYCRNFSSSFVSIYKNKWQKMKI